MDALTVWAVTSTQHVKEHTSCSGSQLNDLFIGAFPGALGASKGC